MGFLKNSACPTLCTGFVEAVNPALAGMSKPAQAAASIVVGGTSSVLTGGKFANGAVTASFQLAFNHWWENEEDLNSRRDATNKTRLPGRIWATGHRVAKYGAINMALEYRAAEGAVPMWISAGPEGGSIGGFDLLVSDSNLLRPTDIPSDNFTVGEVIPLKGTSATTYFTQLQAAEKKYCDCLDYDLFPGVTNGHNSNSFVVGVVSATGGSFSFNVSDFYGGNKPAPK